MPNTRRAVREFYLNSHYNSVSAKVMFPFFYRKFLKWLGEIPAEIEEEKMNLWISGYIPGNLETIYLLIPLQKRVLVLEWGSGDGDPDNSIFIGPLELMKDRKLNDTWWREHHEQVRGYNHFTPWEEEVWKA